MKTRHQIKVEDTLKCNPIDKESRKIQKEAAKQHGSRRNTITENKTRNKDPKERK